MKSKLKAQTHVKTGTISLNNRGYGRVRTGVRAGRDYEQEATSVEIPNLVITLAES